MQERVQEAMGHGEGGRVQVVEREGRHRQQRASGRAGVGEGGWMHVVERQGARVRVSRGGHGRGGQWI